MKFNTPTAWAIAALEVVLPDPLEPYLPIIVLEFNEEKYGRLRPRGERGETNKRSLGP